MRELPYISQEEIKSIIVYNPDTGGIRKIRNHSEKRINKSMPKRGQSKNPYIQINGHLYPLRVLAWLYMRGELTKDIACRDKDNSNIKFYNLYKKDLDSRTLGYRYEYKNPEHETQQSLRLKLKDGYEGAIFDLEIRMWRAVTVMSNGEQVYLGNFTSKEKAEAKIDATKLALGQAKKLMIRGLIW